MRPTAYRITITRGKLRKRLLLCDGPIPRVGDDLYFQGVEWEVERIREEAILFAFKRDGARLKQVFPVPLGTARPGARRNSGQSLKTRKLCRE